MWHARGRDARLRRRWRASHPPRDRDRLRHDYSRRGDAGAAPPRCAVAPSRARPRPRSRASRVPQTSMGGDGDGPRRTRARHAAPPRRGARGRRDIPLCHAKRRARRRGGRLPSRARRRSCRRAERRPRGGGARRLRPRRSPRPRTPPHRGRANHTQATRSQTSYSHRGHLVERRRRGGARVARHLAPRAERRASRRGGGLRRLRRSTRTRPTRRRWRLRSHTQQPRPYQQRREGPGRGRGG